MELIPVVDLLNGRAVAARAGDRAGYRPLATPLCPDGWAETLVASLLRLAPFPRLYIADLDAIRGQRDQRARILALQQAFPGLELWVDAGIASLRSLQHLLEGGLTPVLGSETLPGPRLLEQAQRLGRPVLSLDYQGRAFQGPPGLDRRPTQWPDRVVGMTLAHVGMASGPDLHRLAQIRRLKPGARLYAAGGVRGGSDLEHLTEVGVDGALVATALHQGWLHSWLTSTGQYALFPD